MSSRILSSSRPDSWIPYLLDKAWNATTEGVFNLLRGNESLNPVCRLAEVAVINVLKKIDHGHLSVVTPTRTYTFPSTDVPHKETVYDNEEIVEIRVLESTFWLRLGIMSDLGFAEAYMFSEVDCDNLPALFRLFLNNRDAFATLNSPFSSVFIRISGVIAKSRFLNSLGNAQGNIGAHYDISNDMFIAFLSKDMTYSCAIFPDLDADLYPVDRAQDTKKPTGSDQRNAVTKENAFSMEVIDTLLSYPSPPVHDFAYPSASSGSLGSPASPSPPLFALSSVSGEFPLADASAFTTSSSGPQGALLDAEASTSTFVTSTSFPNEEEKASTSGELVTKFNKLQGGIEAEDEDELYQAQVRKLDYIIKKADIRPGHRVLEIGSGWGSLALRIAQNIPDTTVDTITLSLQQQQFVQKRILETSYSAGDGDGYVDRDGKHRVRVHLMDYRAMPIEWEHSFDRVVSIEMIEAVGKEYLELYWAQIDWALKRHTGAGVIQCITIPEARYDAYCRGLDFIQKWTIFNDTHACGLLVFPGGHLPTLNHLVASLTAGSKNTLVVDSISNIGPHYARTLREWRRRFEWAFDGAIVPALKREYPDVMDGPNGEKEIEVFRRKWIFYYCYCEIGFATRSLGDHIISFTRDGFEGYGCHVFG